MKRKESRRRKVKREESRMREVRRYRERRGRTNWDRTHMKGGN